MWAYVRYFTRGGDVGWIIRYAAAYKALSLVPTRPAPPTQSSHPYKILSRVIIVITSLVIIVTIITIITLVCVIFRRTTYKVKSGQGRKGAISILTTCERNTHKDQLCLFQQLFYQKYRSTYYCCLT